MPSHRHRLPGVLQLECLVAEIDPDEQTTVLHWTRTATCPAGREGGEQRPHHLAGGDGRHRTNPGHHSRRTPPSCPTDETGTRSEGS